VKVSVEEYAYFLVSWPEVLCEKLQILTPIFVLRLETLFSYLESVPNSGDVFNTGCGRETGDYKNNSNELKHCIV